nr:nucleotide-binding alpha-beta plait domain-containing protein [Tanacetum cinerariifolium]
MGSYRSKEDDVSRISTSIYVSNFPESFSAKDLFHSCKKYGHVDDTFIPFKRSKDGKRFGFVRFINVFNVERLVSNLCTIWVDRSKFHADIARFHRAPLNNNKVLTEQKFGYNRNINNVRAKEGVTTGSSKSYVHAENMGVRSWFSVLKQASSDFIPEGRIVWVEIEGVPFKLWYKNTFKRIAAKWGELLDVDDQEEEEVPGWVPECVDDSDDDESDNGFKDGDAKVQNGGRCGNDSDEIEVPETVFEESLEQKVNQSEDPFGFTPNGDNNEFCMHEENVRSVNEADSLNCNMEENQNGQERNSTNKGSKEEISGSLCSGANVFNAFIANASLEEVPLGGSSFTWCHKSATKMSKLD